MKQVLEILIGLILIIAVIWFLITTSNLGWGWWTATKTVIKGTITIIVFLIGVGLVFLGFSELKS